MPKEKILVVEDERDILELIKYNLVKDDYRVTGVGTGEDGLARARAEMPDLVLLDLMLPGVDGLEVCRKLKNDPNTSQIAIVMLTAKGEEADIVAGLEMGADDYITKPFSPRILTARIKAVMRRRAIEPPDETATVNMHELVIHPGRHEVRINDEAINLTATEFRVLQLLSRRPGWVFTRRQIVDAVHGDDYPVTERSVDVQIVGLRKKLGPAGDYIETVRGVGYRFKE